MSASHLIYLAILSVSGAIAGGFAFALRGGLIETGSTQLARAFWMVIAGMYLCLTAGLHEPIEAIILNWATPGVFIALFLGVAWLGHAGHQDAGSVRSTDAHAPKDGRMWEWITAPVRWAKWLYYFLAYIRMPGLGVRLAARVAGVEAKESGLYADMAGALVIGAARAALVAVAFHLAGRPEFWSLVPLWAAAFPLAYWFAWHRAGKALVMDVISVIRREPYNPGHRLHLAEMIFGAFAIGLAPLAVTLGRVL